MNICLVPSISAGKMVRARDAKLQIPGLLRCHSAFSVRQTQPTTGLLLNYFIQSAHDKLPVVAIPEVRIENFKFQHFFF